MQDATSEVPWGRPPVREVPVPPFASLDEHLLFLRCLAVHVAASAPGVVQRNDVVLATLLADEAEALRWRRDDFPPHLSPLAMRVAVRSYFPAPWTPRTLVDALVAAGLRQGEWMRVEEGSVAWGGDPVFRAVQGDDGSWEVTRSERGHVTRHADLPDDDALVLLLLEHQRSFPFPLGHRTDGVPVERLVASAAAGTEAWARHSTLPYLVTWDGTVAGLRGVAGGAGAMADPGR